MKMAKSTSATLPDDVVLEILTRLDGGDVATLFRCATVSKGWRRLVAEPSFLLHRIRWPSSVVGFFTQRILDTKLPGTRPMDANSQLAFVPLLPGPSPLGTQRRLLSSLVQAEDATAVVDRSVPLSTRGGLLVVRLFPQDHDLQPNVVCLAVCNMLAGAWDWLPELDCNTQFRFRNDPYSCGILPSSDGGAAFKVLMIGTDKEKSRYNLHTFASGEASWRAPIKCFDMMEFEILSMEQRRVVLCRGIAHWLFVSHSNYFHVLRYNVETERVASTKLLSPTPPVVGDEAISGTYLTTTAGGTLLALHVYSGDQLEIWTHDQRNTDGDAKWERTRVINHKLTELFQLEQPYLLWETERSCTLFIMSRTARRLYKTSLDNWTLEEVTYPFPDNLRGMVLPVEIDWPTFFMVRLGGP